MTGILGVNKFGRGIISGIDAYTVLQLSFDGTDGATSTIDDTGRHTISFVGNAQIDTAQSKFGGSSLLLDGTGDYLTIPDSADWDMSGGEDWTIEAFIRFPSAPAANMAFMSCITDINNYWQIEVENTGGPAGANLYAQSGGSALLNISPSTPSWAQDTWYHFCIERSGTTYRLYKDGSILVSGTDSDKLQNLTGTLNIGALIAPITVSYFNGWIDELRISKGIARYNGAFTPPTAPFPD